jgi:hypothetical protein
VVLNFLLVPAVVRAINFAASCSRHGTEISCFLLLSWY